MKKHVLIAALFLLMNNHEMPLANEVDCKPNLYALTSKKQCSDASDSKAKRFFAIYSKPPADLLPKREFPPLHRFEIIELVSLNRQLSSFGPDAAAKFLIACEYSQNYTIRFDFPGYPFAQGEGIPITFIFEDENLLQLHAQAGSQFDQIIIASSEELHKFLHRINQYRNPIATVRLADSDGVKINAKFDFADVIHQIENTTENCM